MHCDLQLPFSLHFPNVLTTFLLTAFSSFSGWLDCNVKSVGKGLEAEKACNLILCSNEWVASIVKRWNGGF